MWSESGIEGRMIGGRRLEGLWVVLGAVEIVPAVEDVVGFGAGLVGAGRGFEAGIQWTEVAVAIELESPLAGLMEVVRCEIVEALVPKAAFATSVVVVILVPVEIYTRTDRTQHP